MYSLYGLLGLLACSVRHPIEVSQVGNTLLPPFRRFEVEALTMFTWQLEKTVEFARVPDSEDSEELLGESETSSVGSRRREPSRNSCWIVTVIILAITAVTSGMIGAWAGRTLLLDPDRYSIQHTSHFCMVELLIVYVEFELMKKHSSYCERCRRHISFSPI